MAEENEDGQEKTEEPTERKREQAREKGQVPRSKELTTSLMMLSSAMMLYLFGGYMGKRLQEAFTWAWGMERELFFDDKMPIRAFRTAIIEWLLTISPIALILLVVALVAPGLMGGWLFTPESMAPSLDKINPMKGIKRMFGVKGLMELVKSIAKVTVVGLSAWLVYNLFKEDFQTLAYEPLQQMIGHAAEIFFWAFFILSGALFLIAAIDVPFQIHEHTKSLKMTKQEIKEEYKDTEGKPEVKSKIRQLQRQMAQGRMMEQVPQADVVVTNPTHYAVALKYDQLHDNAPRVLAKGSDKVALRIREIAIENKIAIFEEPPLARALYYTAEVNDEVPSGLYVAVAQVLAYVYQLRNSSRYRGRRPARPNPEIPEEFMQYTQGSNEEE